MFVESLMILLGWLAVGVFVIASAYKMYKVATSPLNVRWEVYPVPHEAGARSEYGGSYMEEIDWAKKARSSSLANELAEMACEIFLLERVRKHNPYGIWLLSLAMHWGLYLGIGWLGLLIVDSLVGVAAPASLTTLIGVVASALGTIGALGLLVKRATDRNLSVYTAPVDYFNLLFIASIFVLGLASWAAVGSFAPHRAYVGSVLTFQATALPPFVILMFLVLECFVIYMPFSKLIHYFAKYFTYHEQLWDDSFNRKGSATDEKIARQLAYTTAWSAPHLSPGKSWLEQAQNHNLEQDRKR